MSTGSPQPLRRPGCTGALVRSPLAFAMDPERAHYRTMGLFGLGLTLPLIGADPF